jgi:hypothetical protein
MRTSTRPIILALFLIVAAGYSASLLAQQQRQAKAKAAAPKEESDDLMTTEEFTGVLKEVWTFLKEETDKFREATKEKTEFETTAEFNQRVVELRRQLLENVTKFIRDKKLDERDLGVLFRATLQSYDADAQVYAVTTKLYAELPYNIPGLQTTVASNPYTAVADSIRRGYRTQSLYLKMDPFRWRATREEAQEAKKNEADLDFRVWFRVDVSVNEVKGESRITLIPRRVELLNTRANKVYWEQRL